MFSKTSACFLLMVLSVAMLLTAQDEAGRQAAQAKVIRHLEKHFDMIPMAKWGDRERSELPGLLEEELESAKDKGSSQAVLGVLDCIEKFTQASSEHLELMAQVAWLEGFHRDALNAAKKTPLTELLAALDRERRGVPSGREVTSAEVVRRNEYSVVNTYVTWGPFRTMLLKNDVRSILGGDAYLLHGDLPDGFLVDWFADQRGPTVKWDQAWESAWKARDLPMARGLFKRIRQYRPEGLSQSQRDSLVDLQSSDWGLPYLFARTPHSNELMSAFEPSFLVHVQLAHLLLSRQLVQAEELLTRMTPTPRDWYEISLLQESIGTEATLTSMVIHENRLLQDPHVPGWTLAQAEQRLARAKTQLDQIKMARLAAEKEAAAQEQAVKQERARQEAAAKVAAARQAVAIRQAAAKRAEMASLAAKAKAEKQAERDAKLADFRASAGADQSLPSLSARRLNAIYQENEVAADEQFRGKLVEIQGTISEISKDFTDTIYLVIPTGQYFQDIHAYFGDSDKTLISSLRRGQQVRIIGRVRGLILKSVVLEHCKIDLIQKAE